MQPQGTALTNAAYFAQLTADINAIDGCAALQAVVNAAIATLQAEISAIEAQIAALLPIITIPSANLGAIIGWITSFVAPQLLAYERYAEQLAATLAQIAALATAIENAAARIEHCTITIPPIVTV